MDTRNLQNITEGRTESGTRSRARRMGYAVRMNRGQISINNRGQYQLVRVDSKQIVAGERFDLSLDDVDALLDEADKDIVK